VNIQAERELRFDELAVSVYTDNVTLGRAAAVAATAIIRSAIAARGVANLIIATGNSQLTFLHSLREQDGIDWPAVNVFHIDEYIALPPGHPAGFPAFLRQHLIDHVPVGAFFPVPGHAQDVAMACRAYEYLLRAHPADLCCLGIGENGHIAFNDPPVADFEDPVWVKVVALEEASRRQQAGEGHFPSLEAVPTHAITLTVPALRAARRMLCIVPEARKARAVRESLFGPISTACPASILRRTPHCRLLLDRESAAEILHLQR
jgi:glucosamine-6-phosphate deaminase